MGLRVCVVGRQHPTWTVWHYRIRITKRYGVCAHSKIRSQIDTEECFCIAWGSCVITWISFPDVYDYTMALEHHQSNLCKRCQFNTYILPDCHIAISWLVELFLLICIFVEPIEGHSSEDIKKWAYSVQGMSIHRVINEALEPFLNLTRYELLNRGWSYSNPVHWNIAVAQHECHIVSNHIQPYSLFNSFLSVVYGSFLPLLQGVSIWFFEVRVSNVPQGLLFLRKFRYTESGRRHW